MEKKTTQVAKSRIIKVGKRMDKESKDEGELTVYRSRNIKGANETQGKKNSALKLGQRVFSEDSSLSEFIKKNVL